MSEKGVCRTQEWLWEREFHWLYLGKVLQIKSHLWIFYFCTALFCFLIFIIHILHCSYIGNMKVHMISFHELFRINELVHDIHCYTVKSLISSWHFVCVIQSNFWLEMCRHSGCIYHLIIVRLHSKKFRFLPWKFVSEMLGTYWLYLCMGNGYI